MRLISFRWRWVKIKLKNSMKSFYQKEIQRFEEKIKKGKKQLMVFAMLRLGIFSGIALVVYILWGKNPWLLLSILLGIVVFMQFVLRHAKIKKRVAYLEARKKINEVELNALNGKFDTIENGEKHISSKHPFNQDIDLFGKGSLFQQVNRTATPQGEQFLADWFNKNETTNVLEKQKVIQELAQKTEWRHHFFATSQLNKDKNISQNHIQWLKDYKAFLPHWTLWLVGVFSALSIGMITGYSFGIISGMQLIYWLLIGLAIVGVRAKKTTELYNTAFHFRDSFAQYSEILFSIENETFETKILQKLQSQIKSNKGKKASAELKKLAKWSDNLGNRNNILMSPIINGFFLWDYFCGRNIETWISKNENDVSCWLSTLFAFEGMNSLGNYSFNHKTFIYPKVQAGNFELQAKKLGHPLISAEKCVTNDVQIAEEQFFIVTGANMAGKSTFLRTIGMSLLMANSGLPVFAESFRYTPVKLISSMRTTDSLENESSYFHAEISRLKYIIDRLQNGKHFIILDEILKGTNSKDKAEGSAKFLLKLLKTGSTGIIATHDLSLCELEQENEQISNYCFEALIENNELSFNYQLNSGVCKNMNASFLLEKMGIV